jgi:alpha-glucosidase
MHGVDLYLYNLINSTWRWHVDEKYVWWRDGVIYQIYPRSYKDDNQDGIGDLEGILSKLDYLKDLGVDAIWLSPVYPTPDRDFGYDVSNYIDIDPRFGTLAVFDRLIKAAHSYNIHVIMDLVLNHSSDQHPWFIQSRSSKDNEKRDWYLWKPANKNGRMPNNWQSVFGGPGWQLDPITGEYYFHMFLKEQPDLNWRNPQVRQAMLGVFKFWLERGVDGFRLDVFNGYFKDKDFQNNPLRPGLRGFDRQKHIHDADQPEMIPLLGEIREMLDSYGERYTVGETFLATPEKAHNYSGPGKLHAAFNFVVNEQPWQSEKLRRKIMEWEMLNQPDGWPNYVFNNHDIPRTTTRYNFDAEDHMAKVAATLLLTLKGTPFLYYGEEIGMQDISLKRQEIMDPPGKKFWPIYKGRDGCRSPMQWDSNINAGFSTVKPWLKLHPGYKDRNVEKQLSDPYSLLSYYRTLIDLRKQKASLHKGAIQMLDDTPNGIIAYIREYENNRIIVLLNLTKKAVKYGMPKELDPTSQITLLDSTPEWGFRINEKHFISIGPMQSLILEHKLR